MIVPIIPSLNPDEKLLELVSDLEKDFNKIIIINDGSSSKDVFNKLKKHKKCIILEHEINKGKGEALKTAFRYYQECLITQYDGIITLDADGQHLKEDVLYISQKLKNNAILGTRCFNTKETPLRNKLGNRITSKVFKWLYGVYLKDTQTGLRAFPNRLIDRLINIDGSRYEYEINVLIKLVKLKEKMEEIDIKTVYLENSNKKSHFNVLKDSYHIYKLMFKNR